ncbi:MULTISPECIES: ABC-type transport auxiliary lipoprotein family protein [Mesorhizobium]|uniref:ABC transporter n=1 Tax=Mesorhizobium denitrificans TaxID=2294114 RepID=A0A371XBM6_9HYPH|nr:MULTISPECIES: ABC-type transport auxiliary lipoprotein family protein [Mesorhizobium]RFC66637.1 ABC transporter [Mesorhizobium denitrificans]
MRVSIRAIATAVALSLSVSGCALLGGKAKPLDTYELTAPGADKGKARRGVQILITEPSALKALDSQNIVIKPQAGSIEYLSGAQWADRLPKVIQARLAETFQKSGQFAGVGKPGEGLAIDYQVVTEIRAFNIRLDGQQRAHVTLFVRILNDRNGVVRAARVFEADAFVSGSGNNAYVDALDAAFGKAATDIVSWTASII